VETEASVGDMTQLQRGALCIRTTTNQEAIQRIFLVINRYVGNLPAMPDVFPDYRAPVVRNAGDEH